MNSQRPSPPPRVKRLKRWVRRTAGRMLPRFDATKIYYEDVQSKVEAIPGYLVPGQEEFLFEKVRSLPIDATIVEIGSYCGRSTVAMGYACSGTARRIYCIDPWEQDEWKDRPTKTLDGSFTRWSESVRSNGLQEHVSALRGRSDDVLQHWKQLAEGRLVDFVFIDGSHEYLDVLRDFELSFPLVRPGGWVAFHDVVETWPGPLRVWQEHASAKLLDHEFESTIACGRKP